MNFRGKKVLLRVDFNVLPLKPREPRILKTISTIKYLLKKKAKIILLTHLETNDGKTPSTKKLFPYLKKFLPMGEIKLFENLRKFPGEKKNDLKFAKYLANLGDIYVNEAFSDSHRKHASIVLLPKLLPSSSGLLFKEEIKNLSRVFNPTHPFTLILGGGKIETKLPLLRTLLAKTDCVLLGGIIGNKFLKRKMISSGKIFLPIDVVESGGRIYDVGPKTIESWTPLINKSKLVVWNGPLGFLEKGFTDGTRKLVAALKKSKAKIIIGGGDTADCLPRNLPKNIFISTGGGAMLEFLAKGTLPGIEALKKQ
ncbi:hypothetical protein A2661_00065 [Candidatus Giovannonibacteria bacterium RIFCSPHIGHO2_01_FULL_45_24]|uniref:Phosphoglycerate kinase n=1 Tax=Candidatus Giovannonibacteria bacterium RIFCSPLOWO2_01_FULL_46_32 TaxID=1798353 RepID=A0A1F5XJP1_9BACT|nr:MAG: hypothetical protein A2661_00065 [Candidatus Giovannonibacteria bacterium RIFCSPHIGHO2_01_FULL_45_24]OGF87681.1 MAG: hypothetical protein A3B19_01695 [Candidatus Giovannonibacteria bacterium RIFCSPLOWO2_01_FULL_46_32]